jgi:arylsulfatase A-like enzyme
MTGVHQQTLGSMHMRTRGAAGLPGGGPVDYDAVPPPEVKAFPELLRRAGYYTINVGKFDYQFGTPFTMWDASGPGTDWRKRPAGRPFLAFINLPKTHESYVWPETTASDSPLAKAIAQRNTRDLSGKPRLTDPARVVVPPYLPDTPVVRADLARLYDNLAFEEAELGRILAALRADGVLDNTVVIVSSDHGDGLPRVKRSIYNDGLRVPLLVRVPTGGGAGEVRPQPVSLVDLAPTILTLAKAPVPRWMQGRPMLGPKARPNGIVFAAADRFDEQPERRKTAIDGRYQYVRNYRPDLAELRPLAFRDQLPTMQELWRLRAAGQLSPAAARAFEPYGKQEELYDLRADPRTVRDLASDPRRKGDLKRLSRAMDAWIARTGDLSALPEPELVTRLWGGSAQPVTLAPTVRLNPVRDGVRLELASATQGASLGYRLGPTEPWSLYSKPVTIPAAGLVEAKAVRYGYLESQVTRAVTPAD